MNIGLVKLVEVVKVDVMEELLSQHPEDTRISSTSLVRDVADSARDHVNVRHVAEARIAIDGDTIEVVWRKLGAPDASVINWVVRNIAMPSRGVCYERDMRKKPFRIMRHVGMSGCVEARLEVLEDARFAVVRRVAEMHLSMNDRFNAGVPRMWVGDYIEFSNALFPHELSVIAADDDEELDNTWLIRGRSWGRWYLVTYKVIESIDDVAAWENCGIQEPKKVSSQESACEKLEL